MLFDILQFEDKSRSKRLRKKFHTAMYEEAKEPAKPVEANKNEIATTVGHALYMIYRLERIKQGWAEFKWSSMTEAQRLVWERTAQTLGLTYRP